MKRQETEDNEQKDDSERIAEGVDAAASARKRASQEDMTPTVGSQEADARDLAVRVRGRQIHNGTKDLLGFAQYRSLTNWCVQSRPTY